MAEEQEAERPRGGRVRRFVRERPGTTLAIAAGAAALMGAEWALPALFGGAVVALVSSRTGPQLRQRLRARGREILDRVHERLHEETAEPRPPENTATPPPQ